MLALNCPVYNHRMQLLQLWMSSYAFGVGVSDMCLNYLNVKNTRMLSLLWFLLLPLTYLLSSKSVKREENRLKRVLSRAFSHPSEAIIIADLDMIMRMKIFDKITESSASLNETDWMYLRGLHSNVTRSQETSAAAATRAIEISS